MTDVSEIAERLRAVLNDGLSSVAICNKNDLRAILDDREMVLKERDVARENAQMLADKVLVHRGLEEDAQSRISQLEAELSRARGRGLRPRP